MKLKKQFCLLLAVLALLFCAACGKEEPIEPPVPEESQLKSICQLSVLDGYFHNVAKYEPTEGKKFLWMTKYKKVWVEYTGIAKYGLDASKVSMEVSGKNVTITMPKAKLLYCKVESNSLDENSYIVDTDSPKITADDSKAILSQAQSDLSKTASTYEPLLTLAQEQAQKLMEDYIKNIVSASGADADYYTVNWVYLDE